MAKGKKSGGKDFKKGESGNLNGRPGLPSDLKQIKALKPSFVRNVISKISRMTEGELKAHIKNPYTTVIDLTISKIFQKSVDSGDYMRLNFLLDRSIGKVKEEMDLNLKPIVTYVTSMTEDGRMLQDLLKEEVEDAGRRSKTDSKDTDS